MESQRNLLVIGLLFVSFLLFTEWQNKDNPVAVPTTTQAITNGLTGDVPAGSDATTDAPNSEQSNKLITISSDVLELTIDTVGGDIVRADLLDHATELDAEERFTLLQNDATNVYIAQSGLIGANGPDANTAGRPQYSTTATSFTISGDTLSIPLSYTDANGVQFTKVFMLTRGSYDVEVSYQVNNQSANAISVQMYGQLKQNIDLSTDEGSSMMMQAYRGAALGTTDKRYEKYDFSDISDANLSRTTTAGWVGMLQHYFVSAWIPGDSQNHFYSLNIGRTDFTKGQAIIGFKQPVEVIAANSEATISAKLWVGPKLQDQMGELVEGLDLTVDYSWLWFIAQPLFKLLQFFHGLVGNWGIAVIMITFTVRGAMYPLTKAQYTSMAKMRLLQPKLTALREKCGDDKQKMSQSMMALYKEEKVNPLGGCFPMIIQMPIFISLYWALMESVELRHAPFALWINDLSAQDPYYVLPLLMGVTMYMIQKMSPTQVQDPMQQKVMQFMPVMFTFFFLWFPAGLVLYWLMSNVVTIIQQTIIFRALEKEGLHSKK
ncbi:membrane protein insertase YidC [Moritella sp. F3]|uniref:membrane protein insertase YidC n=1 Tax=Moritella sp. F3 TaxID=2718882 RepID=UPI0018E1B81F|nr:membrane protein insertase YidC [Moritella sp. F3]GIC78902.1 membrane protein insertase YidC [Moritella sp. F1]GIC83961.1 membrane protein insertase YidC [Moritella sp. F3]